MSLPRSWVRHLSLALVTVVVAAFGTACTQESSTPQAPGPVEEIRGGYEPVDPEPVEEWITECFEDCSGGSWCLEVRDISDTGGAYKRFDGNGDLTSAGTWEQTRDGGITYSGSGDEEGAWTPNSSGGWDYSGTDQNGDSESGTICI
jgi:hypothetical protein